MAHPRKHSGDEEGFTLDGLMRRAGFFRGKKQTILRYVREGLIPKQRDGRWNRYDATSLTYLRLIVELKTYNFDLQEMKQTFEKVPLPVLERSVGKLVPWELYRLVERHKVRLDLASLYK